MVKSTDLWKEISRPIMRHVFQEPHRQDHCVAISLPGSFVYYNMGDRNLIHVAMGDRNMVQSQRVTKCPHLERRVGRKWPQHDPCCNGCSQHHPCCDNSTAYNGVASSYTVFFFWFVCLFAGECRPTRCACFVVCTWRLVLLFRRRRL